MTRKTPLTLSKEQADRVRAALLSGATRDEAALTIGIRRQALDTLLRPGHQLADVRVGRGRRERKREPTADPTPDEIRWATALLRRGWTPDRWGVREPDDRDEGRHGPP